MSKQLDKKTEELLSKLQESRNKLEIYGNELETLKENVKNIFPKEVNYRSKWVMDEKVKTISEFFTSLLRIRVEINKTIKDEITLRSNLDKKTDDIDQDDIRKLVEQIDNLKKEEGNDKKEQILKVIE